MRLCHLVLACLLIVPSLSLAASQVYRWKDAKGVVHFADAPPPNGVKYKIVNIDTGVARDPVTPAPAAPVSATASAADSADGSQPVKDTPDNRAKLCVTLQSNIDILKSSQIITTSVDNTTPISAEQRATRLASAESQYKAYCSK